MFTNAGALPYLCYLRSSILQVSVPLCGVQLHIELAGPCVLHHILFRRVNDVDGLELEISSLFNTLARLCIGKSR
jgi:hypothetical protein